MGQVTVFSGPERRRRWSDEERLQILSEAFAPGACVAEVCRRHDISSALIYTWRRKLLDAGAAQEADGVSIAAVARLGARLDPDKHLPKPLYLRGPDAKPQAGFAIRRA